MDISDATLVALGSAIIAGSVIVLCVVRWRRQYPIPIDTTIIETIPAWK